MHELSTSNGGQTANLAASAQSGPANDAIRALPADFVKRHRILPLRIVGGTIHLATAEPGNQRVIDDIRLLTGLEVEEHETRRGRESCKRSPSATR